MQEISPMYMVPQEKTIKEMQPFQGLKFKYQREDMLPSGCGSVMW